MSDVSGEEYDLRPLRWQGDSGRLLLLDQTRLPTEETWLEISDIETLCEAIRSLRVRGAPAIGIAAAYGMALVARRAAEEGATLEALPSMLEGTRQALAATRPTAVNLFWALEEMQRAAREALAGPASADQLAAQLERRALAIHEDDLERGRAMGAHGAELLEPGSTIMTHCNTGGLATGGYGTALGVIRAGHATGKVEHVFATETRPLLQGARLTAWELNRLGIAHTLIVDSAAAHTMREKEVRAVIVGADRIASNGDVANKVGTYALAIAARAHDIPFYVAAPLSTLDRTIPDGNAITIEERGGDEVTTWDGRPMAPVGTNVYAPAFDVTPTDFIGAIVTERGVISPVSKDGVRKHLGEGRTA
jgi:methylthioribose-1-phosphate isomerase